MTLCPQIRSPHRQAHLDSLNSARACMILLFKLCSAFKSVFKDGFGALRRKALLFGRKTLTSHMCELRDSVWRGRVSCMAGPPAALQGLPVWAPAPPTVTTEDRRIGCQRPHGHTAPHPPPGRPPVLFKVWLLLFDGTMALPKLPVLLKTTLQPWPVCTKGSWVRFLGQAWEATNRCFSLASMFLFPVPSL